MNPKACVRILICGLMFLGATALAGGPTIDPDPVTALIILRPPAQPSAEDQQSTPHRDVVVWPLQLTKTGADRLLSLMSGIDWQGDDFDLSFRSSGPRSFADNNFDRLLDIGYLDAREKWLRGVRVYAVSRPVGQGAANRDELLLALSEKGNGVEPVPFRGPWPAGGLLVFEAENANEEADLLARLPGRSLTIEVPPQGAKTWGAFYTRGAGWPAGFPVDPGSNTTGFLAAREAVHLLLRPTEFKWRLDTDSENSLSVWFAHVRGLGPKFEGTCALAIAFVFGCAAYCIKIEQRGNLAAGLLIAAALFPAEALLGGAFEQRFGIEPSGQWFFVAAALLGLLTWSLSSLLGHVMPGVHALLGTAVVGLLTCLISDPRFSIVSNIFGWNITSVSPEAIASLLAYLTAIVAFTKGSNALALWLGRLIPVGVGLVGYLRHDWWLGNDATYLEIPIIALLAGEDWLRWPFLFVIALLPSSHSDPFRHGVVWAPTGAVPRASATSALNFGRYFAFLISPGLMTFAVTVGILALFGDEFLRRQLKVLLHRDPRLKALPAATLGIGAMAILNPVLLPGALYAAYGSMIVVFFTGVRSL